MTGIALHLTVEGLAEATAAIGLLADTDMDDLAYAVGALVESQTQRRIADEKTAPDGTRWPDWSPRHAATRRPGQSLLVGENDLLTSVQNYTTGTEARVGTPLVYGAIHQLGGSTGRGTIPARAYLGLSEADRDEVVELVVDTLERRLP